MGLKISASQAERGAFRKVQDNLRDNYLQPQKGHEKTILKTLHSEIKCGLSIKESRFNGRNG